MFIVYYYRVYNDELFIFIYIYIYIYILESLLRILWNAFHGLTLSGINIRTQSRTDTSS